MISLAGGKIHPPESRFRGASCVASARYTTGFYLEISGDLYPVMDVVLMNIGHDDEFEEQ